MKKRYLKHTGETMKPKFKVGQEVYRLITKEFEEDIFVFVVCHEKFKVLKRNLFYINSSKLSFYYSLEELGGSIRIDYPESLVFKSYSEALEECERFNKELLKNET